MICLPTTETSLIFLFICVLEIKHMLEGKLVPVVMPNRLNYATHVEQTSLTLNPAGKRTNHQYFFFALIKGFLENYMIHHAL